MLIGREVERRALSTLLAGVRSGTGGALVLRGEPGVGKTALVDDAVARADGLRVVRVTGVEMESHIAFGAVDRIVRPLTARLEALPGEQAALLRGVVTGREDANRFAVALALLGLLAAAGSSEPVLVVIDDAHLVDGPSAEALAFAARRLDHEAVGLLAAARADAESAGRFPADGLPELRVEGLPPDDAAQLAHTLGREVAPRVADVLAHATHGNPLALRAAVAELSDGQLDGTEALPDPLPADDAVATAVRRRLQGLPEATRRALLVLAASPGDDARSLGRALEAAGCTPADLEPAATATLVDLAPAPTFRHPVLRAATYAAADPAARRAAHRAMAAALEGEHEADRRAWQLAAAAEGPDEAVAAALEDSAERARRRGGYAAAARTLERAAALSEGAESHARRAITAGDMALRAADVERATSLFEQARRITDDPRERRRAWFLHGLTLYLYDPSTAPGVFLAGIAELGPGEHAARASMLAHAAASATSSGDYRLGARLARDALADADAGDALARWHVGVALVQSSLLELGSPLLPADPAAAIAEAADHPGLPMLLAYTLLLAGRAEEADAVVSGVVMRMQARGTLGLLPYALGCSAWVAWVVGRGLDARAQAEEAATLAAEAGSHIDQCWTTVLLGVIAAQRGDDAEVEAHVATVRELSARHGLRAERVAIACIDGLLALGRRDGPRAVAAYERAGAMIEENGGHRVILYRWLPYLLEAYVVDGQPERARAALAAARRGEGLWAPTEHDRWWPAAEARSEGLLADDAGFEGHFERALALHDADPSAFERARTELAYGERLRRLRRRAEAREHLGRALLTFERLGATLWAERARAELVATGLTAAEPAGTSSSLADLTPHELRIAATIATGARNHEAAARLFVTPKTVEYHLRNIYRKLGIRSRADLVRIYLAEHGAPAA